MTTTVTPQQAWDTLVEGNRRFVDGLVTRPNSDGTRRRELVAGQSPQAVIFGCGDSRVPAEMVFDQGLGDLFVVRTAGHVLDPAVLGSIEFGTEMLRAPLIVVLAHKSCGAIKATLTAEETGQMPPGFLHTIIERVLPSIIAGRKKGYRDPEEFEAEHAHATLGLLAERSGLIRERVAQGELAAVAVHYDLAQGEAHVVGTLGDISA